METERGHEDVGRPHRPVAELRPRVLGIEEHSWVVGEDDWPPVPEVDLRPGPVDVRRPLVRLVHRPQSAIQFSPLAVLELLDRGLRPREVGLGCNSIDILVLGWDSRTSLRKVKGQLQY